MRLKYVKTTNHNRFMAGTQAVERGGSPEARIHLLNGDPGTGKTKTVDHYGAARDAIYIEGMPGMDLRYMRDYLADQTAVKFATKFEQDKGLVEHFRRTKKPIILDECQHGLSAKAQVVEYLRRIAEQSGVILVLVCHTSEVYRFGEKHMAHIATRIAAQTELKPATPEDCGFYLAELCEVGVDDKIIAAAHEQSGGRYRLLNNAVITLEAIAEKLGKDALAAADIKGIRLCEDAMKLGKRGR